MVWLIVLAVLCGLTFVPLGFRAIYREDDPGVWLLIGPVKFRVYSAKAKSENKNNKEKSGKKSDHKGGNYQNFQPVVRAILDFLSQFRRKIRIRHLEMKLTLAGEDPCDLALNYGRVWAAMGNLVPLLEQLFVIKNRDYDIICDFSADKTRIYARVDATISLSRTILLLSRHGLKVIKELLELKKFQKGGAQL